MPRLQLCFAQELPDDDTLGEVVIDHSPCVVGRHPECDCQINLPFVSRHHCSFFVQDGRVWVQDLNSRNGTFINGEEALRPQRLRDGDEVRLGSLSARVSLRSAAKRDPESGMLVGGGKDGATHKS